ncbi:hypothetical protein [Staphylococcus gallinarum]|uniref:hypothetical protein n=1 Tax=Staphylococcus gallinarum TaxID=1293 RepID=UPI00316CA48C
MIKFELKNKETGKTESYSKEEITMGEAEKWYEYLEFVNKEEQKTNPDNKKVRQRERQIIAEMFKSEGLTEEDVLNMGTKTYAKVAEQIFREIFGEDKTENTVDENEEGKDQEQPQ